MSCSSLLLALVMSAIPLCAQNFVCWFPPGSDAGKCKVIADALGQGSGLAVQPLVAATYPEILKGLASNKGQLAYVGSFASVVIKVRNLGTALVQKVDGKELYSGVMLHPKESNPQEILSAAPTEIAYAIGSSSGESSAKAATGGKAAVAVKDHLAAANAVKAGKARAAFVKNFWWADHKDKFPGLAAYVVPGISELRNTDNVLWASNDIPLPLMVKLSAAAKAAKEAFGAREMKSFDASALSFSQELMRKGSIDPKHYAW